MASITDVVGLTSALLMHLMISWSELFQTDSETNFSSLAYASVSISSTGNCSTHNSKSSRMPLCNQAFMWAINRHDVMMFPTSISGNRIIQWIR